MMTEYYAHSSKVGLHHRLADHLKDVSRAAEAITANKLALTGWGAALGLLHDLGKYSAAFQVRVRGGTIAVDHSTYGAQIATQKFQGPGKLLAYAVLGHHGGLPNGAQVRGGQRTPLLERLVKSDITDASAWQGEIELTSEIGIPDVATCRRDRLGFALAHATRMSFSALVDSDHLDTESWRAKVEGWPTHRGGYPTLREIAERLDRHMANFRADTDVKGAFVLKF